MALQLCGHPETMDCDCHRKEMAAFKQRQQNSSNETMKRVWNNSGPLTRMWMMLSGNTPKE